MPSPPLELSTRAAILNRNSTELTDPELVPSLADRWSHHTGGTHIKVVPFHWRATTNLRQRNSADIVHALESGPGVVDLSGGLALAFGDVPVGVLRCFLTLMSEVALHKPQ